MGKQSSNQEVVDLVATKMGIKQDNKRLENIRQETKPVTGQDHERITNLIVVSVDIR